MRPTRTAALLALGLGGLLATGCADSDPEPTPTGASSTDADEEGGAEVETTDAPSDEPSDADSGAGTQELDVTLTRSDGLDLGTVTLAEDTGGVLLTAELEGFSGEGLHGFHLHQEPVCDTDADDGPFTTAGGHIGVDDADHGGHAGDLPLLLVDADGAAYLSVRTDRVTLDELRMGAALVVHEDPDNAANIPTRYTSEDADAPGPDQDTLDTGDAGDRLACGVIGDEGETDAA